MAKILVSLVSDQTIPNVLFIKEFRDVDRYLFISTEKMENAGKSKWIIEATGIPDEKLCPTIKIDEFSKDDFFEKLSGFDYDDEQFIVNITGGTKIMSHAAFEFFKDFSSEIYYIPGKDNTYLKLFPKNRKKDFFFNYKLSLEKYLRSYGFLIQSPDKKNHLVCTPEYTNQFFQLFVNEKVDKTMVRKMRNFHDKKEVSVESIEKCKDPEKQIPDLEKILNEIGFPYKDGLLSKYQMRYITGGWLEEYIYSLMKKHLNLSDDQIGINIQRQGVQNEFDVMFVYKNDLFIIECKTSVYKLINGRNKCDFNEIVYKNDSLRKEMGLMAKSYLVSMDNFHDNNGEVLQRLKERADFHRIKLIDKHILTDSELLDRIFTKIKN